MLGSYFAPGSTNPNTTPGCGGFPPGGVDPDQIERAVIQAVGRGLATSEALRHAASKRSRRVARLIARLMAAAPDRWVLKGAVALHFRTGPQFRSTMDLDLGRYDDEQAATADLLLAQTVDLGDYFRFAIQRTSRLDALVEGAAVRYHVTAELDRRPFELCHG